MADKEQLSRDVLIKFKELQDARDVWEDQMQEVCKYVLPRLEFWNMEDKDGEMHGSNVYDGTPISALNLLASGLHGYLISPATAWFAMGMEEDRLNDIPEVKTWLQEVEKIFYSSFATSNFYDQMLPYFRLGAGPGTASMYMEEDIYTDRIVYSCRHPREIYIAENIHGEVDTVFRNYQMTARNAVEKFGAANVSDQIRNDASEARTSLKEFEFLHAVFPRTDRDIKFPTAENKRFASVYVSVEDSEHLKGKVARISGYDDMPYATWRWAKNSNEVYGRSPTWDAYYDIRAANEAEKGLTMAAELSINPPLNVPSGLADDVRWFPRGENYYSEKDLIVRAAHTGIDYPIAIDHMERKRKIIEAHYMVDFFLMLAQSERQMTAREVIEKQGEKAAIMGPAVSRLNSECLNPIFDRKFNLLWEAGKIPPPPPVLLEQKSAAIKINYIGPLAQAQQRLFRTQGTEQALSVITPLTEFYPEMKDWIDPDETSKDLLEAYGMAQKNIRTQDKVDEVRKARQEAQEAAIRAEQMEQAAGATRQLAEADKATGGQISKAMGQQQPGQVVQ